VNRSGAREAVDAEPTGRVVVTRDGDRWRADIADLEVGCRAAALIRVDGWVRGVLGLRRGDWVNYEFRTGHRRLDGLVRDARAGRRAAYVAERHSQQATRDLMTDAAQYADLSMRELAILAGLSHQRIQQLLAGGLGEARTDLERIFRHR